MHYVCTVLLFLFYSASILFWLTSDSIQLGLCPDAVSHLQEMKDKLIGISNELLDNAAELSPVQIEKLRQDRLLISSFFLLSIVYASF